MTSICTGDIRPLRSVRTPSTAVKARKAPNWRGILNFLSAWNQKQKDREIERLLACSGGRITDELERRILQSETATDWSGHR